MRINTEPLMNQDFIPLRIAVLINQISEEEWLGIPQGFEKEEFLKKLQKEKEDNK